MRAVGTYYGPLLPSPVYALPGCLEDLPVEHEDYEKRDIECGTGSEDLISDVLTHQAALL
jgi:hypothetical protein